jgi:protein gp37
MSDATNIEWTDTTWNPVRGCSKVSPGCQNCYAERTAARQAHSGYAGLVRIGEGSPRWTGEVRLVPEKLDEPQSWRKPRRVFVNSMSDLFHEKLTNEEIARVFDTMMDERASHHTFQVLTKRALRMRDLVAPSNLGTSEGRAGFWDGSRFRPAPPNIWLGVSVENQAAADERIPLLLETPAAVRFLSVEPLLGPVNLSRWLKPKPMPHDVTGAATRAILGRHADRWLNTIDWVIVGGESGPGARPCDVAWIRSVVEQCTAAGVPCFVKQMGSHAGVTVQQEFVQQRFSKKGGDMVEWPEDLRIREFPKC